MNFLKKLFKTKSEPLQYFIITLNDKIQPIDRGEYYEDPLDKYLQQTHIGEIVGGGTQQANDGEIQFVDIEIQLNSNIQIESAQLKIIEFLESRGAPKNSSLHIEGTDNKTIFGKYEGIGIYLDGVNLDADTYQNCDSNFVVSEIKRLIGDNTELVRFWEFPEKTGLYFYGKSFILMEKEIENFMKEYPLCKNAEIKQIA